MKRLIAVFLIMLLLTGCMGKKQDQPMSTYHFQGISLTVPDGLDVDE